ncbi:MAG: PKD domain-containing protein [Kangiellaceae bacterium]|nr:PKD domain-containing protein [Kangiellaceae bacterium]MCW8997375.1 PKD domain-containing protein [Kangiellaceae bacterium]
MNSKIGLKLKSIPFAALLLFIVACGGGSSEGDRNRGPSISFDIPDTIAEGSQVTFSITATDPDGYIDEYNWTQVSGPDVQFENGNSSITFTVPEVDEDTEIGFLVRVVDDVGAVTAAQLYSTIQDLSSKTTKSSLSPSTAKGLALRFDQVSEPIDMSEDRWFFIVNNSSDHIKLDDYILLAPGLDSISFEVSENETFAFSEISLAPGQKVFVKDRLSQTIWGDTETKSNHSLILDFNNAGKAAYWLKGGRLQLVNKKDLSLIDEVLIGENRLVE